MQGGDGRVVSNFIVQALRGEPLSIYGDGSQTRSFCFVTDLIEGLILLMNSKNTGPINLGNPSERTVLSLAQTIIEQTQSSSSLSYHPIPVDDPKVRRPDIKKAKRLLGWTPTISLEEGLKKTIPYFAKRVRSKLTPQRSQ